MSDDNPMAVYKAAMGFTYDDLAEQFHVSRSVIQRVMEGAYPSIPPRVAEVLAYVNGTGRAEVDAQYQAYVNRELCNVILPPVAIDRNVALEDFDIWASIFLRINGVNFVGRVPHLAIARLLKINVAVIAKFYNGTLPQVPVQVIERLDQINTLRANMPVKKFSGWKPGSTGGNRP